jgi:predicted esterase
LSDLPPVTRFTTERTARIAHLGPPDAGRSLWICLHGYRQLAPWFLRRFRALDDGSRRIVAPEALNRFYVGDPDGRHGPDARVGATWMTREDRDADVVDYTRYLESVLAAESVRGPERPVVVLGFSQGAHTAARWMHASERAVRAVVLWGEGLPHDTTVEHLAGAPRRWILVRGEADGSRSLGREARDEARLVEAGADWTARSHPGGHRIDTDALNELARALDA